MSVLYPRLLPREAHNLYGEYKTLSIEDLMQHVSFRHDAAVYAATGGDRVPETDLKRLRQAVVDVARVAGFPDKTTTSARTEFDRAVGELLHRTTGLAPAEAAARDIWVFLALILMPDISFWRFESRTDERFLAKDLTRHVFGRLWWRAHLVHDPASATPYAALHILGEGAFDQIYARRRTLGGSPQLVRAILYVWNEIDTSGLNETDLLKDFLKRLLRLGAFMSFETLENEQLEAEIRRAAHDSVHAFRAERLPRHTRGRTAVS
ncbi:DUF6339 family protein [Amycolatopsis benzoatilytica]|uniref:DUF6339 family protein n=1 Tax=Amycolatopsis benzoatilytica TaxID=346045 RepID=UPI0012B6876A|nr:DUF6339 family protein [Amycolatopsis benzoatilytica]